MENKINVRVNDNHSIVSLLNKFFTNFLSPPLQANINYFFKKNAPSLHEKKRSPADSYIKLEVKHHNNPIYNFLSRILLWKSKDDKKQEIDIQLPSNIDTHHLPYADVYTEAALKKNNLHRYKGVMGAYRGDTKSIYELYARGGIHPSITKPSCQYPRQGKDILDVRKHRHSSEGSGLVSFTTSKNIAKFFGETYSHRLQKNDYYIYLAELVGPIEPAKSDDIKNEWKLEKEYSQPGGIDADAIISYRRCQYSAGNEQTNIPSVSHCDPAFFVRKDFYLKYYSSPIMEKIIEANLDEGEYIDPPSLKKLLFEL